MKQMIRDGWALAAAAMLILGCDTPSDVLTTAASLRKSDGSWTEWCPPDLAPFIAEAKLGNTCKNAPGSCGVLTNNSCGVESRVCIDEHVQAVTAVTLGCPATRPDAASGYWTSCNDALTNGNSGEACSWVGACTRATEDACCIEMATCVLEGVEPSVVQRRRVCAPGCDSIQADATQNKVSSCTEAVAAAEQFGAPCEAGLVCFSDSPNHVVDASTTDGNQLRMANAHFCANGALMHARAMLYTSIF